MNGFVGDQILTRVTMKQITKLQLNLLKCILMILRYILMKNFLIPQYDVEKTSIVRFVNINL